MKIDASEPGFVVSAAIHALLLAVALVSLARSPKFEDASETAPVDLVTDQQFNQIMKGEKTAKEMLKTPAIRADVQSDTPTPKPRPPIAEAKQDVPTPPPPPRHSPDPGDDSQPPTPPMQTAALPPERPHDLVQPPAPTPPPRPDATSQPPPDSEAADAPMPPVRPKNLQAKEDASHPKDQMKPDQIAKLLRESKPRNQDDPSQAQEQMDSTEIAQLLSRDSPQQRAAAGRVLSKVSSLGSETASADRMSPSLWGALDGLLQEQYKRCWSYLGLDVEHRYIPQIKVEYSEDGSLASEPSLINPPSDPALRTLAESAMRAVRECNPLKIPPQFLPYFDQWKARILRFDPEVMSG